jgi:hypothetical protein
MYSSQEDQLDQLLGTSIATLDITEQEHDVVVRAYQEAGAYLAEYWGDARNGGEIYSQGSMRLGTVTRNIHRNDEIDIDSVARRNLAVTSISQAELKADTGHGLKLFVDTSPDGHPNLDDEGKRCWTLLYPNFHLDILPAVPDVATGEPGILITDTEMQRWQRSNPIGFADWFHGVMRTEWLERKAFIAKSMNVDDVPDWTVKTTLQRTVQALKRHRDIYFAKNLADRPASIIVTTLAARAYRGRGSLYEVLVDVTAKMPTLVEQQNGIYLVCNPVQPEENFADRWIQHPHRARLFFDWIEKAHADFAGIGADRGVDTVLSKMATAFGDRAAMAAEQKAGTGLFGARTDGRLGMTTGTGALVVGGARPVHPHHFHGPASRSS